MTIPAIADEIETGADMALEQASGAEEQVEPQDDPSGQDAGWWLTEPDEVKVRNAVLELWKRDKAAADKRAAKERQREMLRAGIRGVRVIQSEDKDEYHVRAPFGAEESAKATNKAHQLIKRIAATLTVDPPGPEVGPASVTGDEENSAEIAERILKVEGAPSERDDVSMLRQAIDMAGTYASVFSYAYVHPQGAGLVPLEIQAHPAAQTTDDALVITDPMGNQMPADPATLVTRFVRIDGTLTDTAAEAQMVWQPEVREKLMRPSQIRFVPAIGVTGIEDAPGVMVGDVTTLGEVIARHYGGERPDEETCKQLVDWKPEDIDWKRWVPKAHRDAIDAQVPKRPDGTIADDALVVTLCLYFTSGPMAPLGAYLCVGGPRECITRTEWRATIGEGKSARVEYLPLPVAQMRWSEDTASGDPYGIAAIDELAGPEQIRATMLMYALDYVDRFGRPRMFLPHGTTIQPGQLASRDPIYVDPNGQPFFEPLPPHSTEPQRVYDEMGNEMNSISGLEETAQGVSSTNVKSGRHAQQVIEQALVALAGIQQNGNKFVCRVWSLRLTLMRAEYSAPRILRYLGEGGDYQQRTWTGADLMGAGDVMIARGTGTMLPRSAKAELAREELQIAMTLGDQTGVQRYRRAMEGGTAPLLGMQDDPIRQRIERQLAAWRQAAKQQHEQAPPPVPQMVVDPMTQQATQQMMPAPDPVADQAMQIFAPNPTDELPTVAPIRFAELADAMASKAFLTADPRYQQALHMEYERMRAAAGVMTAAEQQQAQAAEAERQHRMQLEQIESKNAQQASSTAFAEKEGGPAAQRMVNQQAVESQMRSQSPQPPMQ